MGEFNIDIQFDDNGNPFLPVENGGIKRGKANISNQDELDEFVSEDDLDMIERVSNDNNKVEVASRPKLSKNGGLGINNIKQQAVVYEQEIRGEKHFTTPTIHSQEDIELTSMNHLINAAEKSEQTITVEIKLNAINKDLFQILSKSFKDKSSKIVDIIRYSNKDIIDECIKNSIINYYEK